MDPRPNTILTIIFDFDGVLTDDCVWVDQDGREMVCCSRRDGLAFDILHQIGINLFILSTEKNPVVAQRAQKLRTTCIQGKKDKAAALLELAEEKNVDLLKTLYVGNDINDIPAMELCGCRACPSDAHPEVQKRSTFILKTPGGRGVAREILEDILKINALDEWKKIKFTPQTI
jgi:3-deoxy-D-manno-octulosonate 8-phosphate phosphatase (KDO 8-P phosphatase)